jgi:hypothetical protein
MATRYDLGLRGGSEYADQRRRSIDSFNSKYGLSSPGAQAQLARRRDLTGMSGVRAIAGDARGPDVPNNSIVSSSGRSATVEPRTGFAGPLGSPRAAGAERMPQMSSPRAAGAEHMPSQVQAPQLSDASPPPRNFVGPRQAPYEISPQDVGGYKQEFERKAGRKMLLDRLARIPRDQQENEMRRLIQEGGEEIYQLMSDELFYNDLSRYSDNYDRRFDHTRMDEPGA